MTTEAVAQTLDGTRASLLVLGPDGTPVPAGFSEYPVFSSARLDGRRHRPASRRDRMRRHLRDVELFSSQEGVASVSEAGWVTAPYERTVLCIRGEDQRTLLTDDGFFLPIFAGAWTHGSELIDEIDRAIPAELVAPTGPPPILRRLRCTSLHARPSSGRGSSPKSSSCSPPSWRRVKSCSSSQRRREAGTSAPRADRPESALRVRGRVEAFVRRRSESVSATAKGSILTLDLGDESVKLTDVEPKGKADELARMLDDVR